MLLAEPLGAATMARFVAVILALGLCATSALAVNVTGIEPPQQVNSTIAASSSTTCSVVLQPFTIFSPTFNSSLPTASPVPPYVVASLSFAISNQGAEAVAAPWSLQLFSSHYQAVLQVGPHTAFVRLAGPFMGPGHISCGSAGQQCKPAELYSRLHQHH